jgi:hypothetical protein
MFEYILTAIILAIVILVYVLSQNKTKSYHYTPPPSKKDLENLGKEFFDNKDFFKEKK